MIRLTAGITPAYAGKTVKDFVMAYLEWDHPRLRGKDGFVVPFGLPV